MLKSIFKNNIIYENNVNRNIVKIIKFNLSFYV